MGHIIALYGVNNLGKSVQLDFLSKKIIGYGFKVKLIKYPIYDLNPTGPMIWNYLRSDNPHDLSPREAQILYTYNRTHFEPQLVDLSNRFDVVILEDYKGTGIAWGTGAGVDKNFLINLNKHLIDPGLSLCLWGKRFLEGKEEGHKHEEDTELIEKVQQIHLELAEELDWVKINANQTRAKVHKDIWQVVSELLNIEGD